MARFLLHISFLCILTLVSLCNKYVVSSSWNESPSIILQNLLITKNVAITKYPYTLNIKRSYHVGPLQLQSNPSIQITEDEVLQYINSKRSSSPSSINRWNSTLVELKKVTKNELKFFSRTSFGNSTDLFENILKKGYKENKVNPFETGLILSIFVGAFISLFVLPLLPIDNINIKNGIGIIGLTLPFSYMFMVTFFPDFLLNILKPDNTNTNNNSNNQSINNNNNNNKSMMTSDVNRNNPISSSSSLSSSSSSSSSLLSSSKRDRLCIHEAGHFLVGYLCGYPILNYEINGERGANLVIGALTTGTTTASSSSSNSNNNNDDSNMITSFTSDGNKRIEKSSSAVITTTNNNNNNKGIQSNRQVQKEQEMMMQKASGSLLCIAMAGIVAEALYYGDAIGGAEDWPLALQIINKYTQFSYNNKLYNSNTLVEEEYLTDENIDQYLRGAVVKCLVLVRIHKDCLMKVAIAMSKNQSVIECIDAIESVPF